jgi:YVTN family beta-propeller protein
VAGDDGGDHHRLQFHLLGHLQVLRDVTPVGLGGAQQRAVLAFLLAEQGRAHSVEQIADALWGESPPAGYAATIQTYIFRLREVLEPDRAKGEPPGILVTEPGGYRLQIDGGVVDAAAFESLLESGESLLAQGRPAEAVAALGSALSLWRGSVLADLADFDFVVRLAGRLEELRLRAVELRTDGELALGLHASKISELTAWTDLYPLREHLQAQRILALYRAGRQADALEAFRQVRRRLMDELGIEPGPELTDLHQSILNQDAGLLVQPAPAAVDPVVQQHRLPASSPARERSGRVVASAAILVVALVMAAVGLTMAYSRSSGLRSLPANSLVRIDSHGSFRDAVTLGSALDGVVLTQGAAWVAAPGANTVSKIDLRQQLVVQNTTVDGAPEALATQGSDLWVANSGAGTVKRLNLKTNKVTETVTVGNQPSAIAIGEGQVWVVNTADDTVVTIDPSTGSPTGKPIQVGLRPGGIAVGAGVVWVSNTGDQTVSPIDAKTRAVGAPVAVGAGPVGLAVSDSAVWVANSLSQTVSRIDPKTRRVVATIPVGDGPQAITLVRGTPWVANEFDGTVTTLDPKKDRAVKRIRTGASVRGLVSDGGSAYVVTSSLLVTGHRGGSLHITAGGLPTDYGSDGIDGIDPSSADTAEVFKAFSLVYDGLVGLQRTEGAAGLTLVPDLAKSLPQALPGGTTYVATLRRGIHYSNGAEVKPDDIRRGLQQELTVGQEWAVARLRNIVGAKECIERKTVCDLSRGVVTNDDTFEIRINLLQPDPDFLYKMTEPMFATPEGEAGVAATDPRPATGPYMIGPHDGSTFTLVRNKMFHQWSAAAQPDGFPDTIVWTRDSDATQAVHDVLAGTADVHEYAEEADDYPALQRSHTERFHSDFTARVNPLFLNTTIPPFNNLDARRAINFAVDRDMLVELVGGASSAEPTCQILLSNFTGYRRYCPYTANPTQDGSYHGPDLPRAVALVDRSGTRGMPVTVTSAWEDPTSLATARYVVQVLKSLGYKAQYASAGGDYFSPDNPGQIGVIRWYMAYPAPSDLLSNFLCGSSGPGAYCNPAMDDLFRTAFRTQLTDQALAYTAWTALDRALTDDAPWLNLFAPYTTAVVSERVGNYLANPKYGPLYGQMWVL